GHGWPRPSGRMLFARVSERHTSSRGRLPPHPLSEPRRLGYPTRYLADLLPANAEVARLRVAVLGSLEHDAIAPFELRLIERLVRDLDQALQTPRRVRLHDRDANAHRHDAAV